MLSSLFIVLLCSSVVLSQDQDSCACVAEEENFSINCNQDNALVAALDALEDNGCDTDCSSNSCQRNFYIIQSHHDYCLPSEVSNKTLLNFN